MLALCKDCVYRRLTLCLQFVYTGTQQEHLFITASHSRQQIQINRKNHKKWFIYINIIQDRDGVKDRASDKDRGEAHLGQMMKCQPVPEGSDHSHPNIPLFGKMAVDHSIVCR